MEKNGNERWREALEKRIRVSTADWGREADRVRTLGFSRATTYSTASSRLSTELDDRSTRNGKSCARTWIAAMRSVDCAVREEKEVRAKVRNVKA